MNHLGKSNPSSSPWRWLLLVGLPAACCCLILWRTWLSNPQRVISRANALSSAGKHAAALAELKPLLQQSPRNGEASYVAGRACSHLNQWKIATGHFLNVPAGDPCRADACYRAADIFLLRLFQLSEAEQLLAESLALDPSHYFAQVDMAAMAGLCGLTVRAEKLRFQLLQAELASDTDLLVLALGDTAAEEALPLENFIRANPADPLARMAQGYHAWQHHQWDAARSHYEAALAVRSDLSDAHARLGRILCELDDEAAFMQWHRALPLAVRSLAETWAARGDWAIRHADISGAIRCYWEAARRDPMNRRAHHQLGIALTTIGEPSTAAPFQLRHEGLQRSLLAAKQYAGSPSYEASLRCLSTCRENQQLWEAWGWARIIRKQFAGAVEDVLDIPQPSAEEPRVAFAAQPALHVDLSRFAVPGWMDIQPVKLKSTTSLASRKNSGSIHFVNDTSQAGLHFQYVNGDSIPGPGMRTFQFTGGGVGVLDYDRDGWPDLYFTQGGNWPLDDPNPPADVLYRNQRGTRFEDVTRAAGIRDIDYSQGLTTGDIDGDGWEDVFVANVAGNRLFHNNGDGTFQEINEEAGISDSAWSTSAVCADFNGDGLPDLYVVNYLTGPDLLNRICQRSDGRPRGCTPHELDAADDQLLLNLGDGRFQDISREAGILSPGGKGLGVVAADFDDSGRLSLFVSNDTTANFFFHNQPASHTSTTAGSDAPPESANGTLISGGLPRFQESAIVTGLAFDFEGRSQACMGIAAGDANGDGKFDLFVTNYFDEYNAFYRRQEGLLFLDSISNSGIRDASLKQLGFGTQFLDADLDGWLDLVVTNGHVDDETDRGIPLYMPTQFFHGTGHGRFAEVDPQDLGPWFKGNYLGRGLATVDWNRDGKEDFVVSHLDSPAALLSNRSEHCGRHLTLQLVGTTSARLPIGTTVRVQQPQGRQLTRQLTAGDGYHASNEKQLIFGVGNDERVNVSIQWPSGLNQTVENLETNQTWLIVEGRRSYRLP